MPLTKEQFVALRTKGLSTEQIISFESGNKPTPQVQEPGFIESVYKRLAEPVANLIARPGQLVQHALGDTQPIEGKFLGLDITDPYSRGSSEIVKDIGRGLETLSLGVGGTGAKSVAETGLKGLIKQGAKEGAVVGLKTGSLMGAGQSLQKDQVTLPQITYDTLFGAGTGALFGGATGAIIPAVTSGLSTAAEIKTGLSTEKGILNKLAERNRAVLNPTQRMSSVEDRFFKDTPSFLAKEYPDMPIEITSNKRLVLDTAIKDLAQKYNAEELAFDSLLKNNGKFVNLTEVENAAVREANQVYSGTLRDKALKQIDDEMSAFTRQAKESGYLVEGNGGQVLIPSLEANILKRDLWQRVKGFGSPESEIYNQSNYIIGSAFKNAIENSIDDAPIKAMNKRLGDFISAIKYLEKRNGAVAGTGGKLSQWFIRTIGGIAGSAAGVPGTIAGAITADKLATFLANPELTTSVLNKLLKRVEKEGKQDILQQAQDILNARMQKAAEVLKLPAKTQTTAPLITPYTSYEPAAIQSKTTTVNPKTGTQYVKDLKTGEKVIINKPKN